MTAQINNAYKNYQRIIKLQDVKEIARNISGFCLNSDDYELSLKLCKYFANHDDPDVKANVIHGLGYIGMNFKKIDINFAKKLLSKASKENNPTIIGAISDAKDDLCHYVKGFSL
jgi:hypothetical protein